ncbi:MAG TPA: HAMP domain-containing sensor histidine kinase [Phototrophicaceae bacterium]|nr:HAMP domain-containing sensor histidine kinase [Phototrophicaceae bacterium]
MRTLSILRSQAFRIVVIYVVMFALSVSALIAFTYWNTERALDAQTDQIINAEITGLAEQYQRLGLRGLAEVVISRSAHGGPGLYLLVDRAGLPIAGNLDGMPEAGSKPHVEIEFDYERRVEGQLQRRRARGRVFPLLGGFRLLVAQDVHERYLTEKLFTTTLPWTVVLMLMLGLIGGGLMSRNMLRRLDQINRTAGEIFAGDFSRRVPVSRAHDEFDTLADSLNRMLDRIERLMKGVREVTDSVAHDLRTPLNRLRNRLEDTLRHLDPNGRESGEIESAMRETDQIIATFNALLLIAEADSGVTRGAMTPVDLAPIADDIAELYEPLAEEKGVTLEIKPAGETLIDGNRSLISQALANLVDNAIKYTPEGGHISVWPSVTPDGVELVVADTGPGIPASERARVVERFVRLEASRNSPGTGLGLSLVAAVARLHNATLILEDNAPGLKAIIRFPRPPLSPRSAQRR